jgi:hypothetical protein
MDFILFLYVVYGLYVAGRIFDRPESADEITVWLLIFTLVVVTWPAWLPRKEKQ